MSSQKVKALILVFVVLFGTGIAAVGCKQKSEETKSWVNTKSMPGNTFKNHSPQSSKRHSSKIVYLGSEYESKHDGFGPGDINFEFKNLK